MELLYILFVIIALIGLIYWFTPIPSFLTHKNVMTQNMAFSTILIKLLANGLLKNVRRLKQSRRE